jgi:MHS family proline/betaine transporter-like MFS transporter
MPRLNRLLLAEAYPQELAFEDGIFGVSNQFAAKLASVGFFCFLLGRVSGGSSNRDVAASGGALTLGNLALALVTPLAVALAQSGGVMGLAGGQMLVLLPVMATIGAQGVLAVELVPLRQRCTVFSLAYSLSMALFAGSSPLVCSWLLQKQGWTWAPALYCSLFAIPALAALRGLGSRADGGHDAGITAAS